MSVKISIKDIYTTEDTSGKTVQVIVAEGDSKSEHTVHVTSEYVQRLGWEVGDVKELVRKSFWFLLEREPRNSILREFDLRDITRYFSSYEREMRK